MKAKYKECTLTKVKNKMATKMKKFLLTIFIFSVSLQTIKAKKLILDNNFYLIKDWDNGQK
jgi:hypothetical protein